MSQNTLVVPSIGTPNILSLYLNYFIKYIAFLRAMNLEPRFKNLTPFCLLLFQINFALFQNKRIPVCEPIGTLSAAWFASTKQCIDITLPLVPAYLEGLIPPNQYKNPPNKISWILTNQYLGRPGSINNLLLGSLFKYQKIW